MDKNTRVLKTSTDEVYPELFAFSYSSPAVVKSQAVGSMRLIARNVLGDCVLPGLLNAVETLHQCLQQYRLKKDSTVYKMYTCKLTFTPLPRRMAMVCRVSLFRESSLFNFATLVGG